jgi:hypothetical protein
MKYKNLYATAGTVMLALALAAPSAHAIGIPEGTPVVVQNNSTDPVPVKMINPITFLVPFDTNTVPFRVHLPKAAVLESFLFQCASYTDHAIRGGPANLVIAVDQEGGFVLPSGVSVDPPATTQGAASRFPLAWLNPSPPAGIRPVPGPLTQSSMGLPVTADVTVTIRLDGYGTDQSLAGCGGHLVLRFMN